MENFADNAAGIAALLSAIVAALVLAGKALTSQHPLKKAERFHASALALSANVPASDAINMAVTDMVQVSVVARMGRAAIVLHSAFVTSYGIGLVCWLASLILLATGVVQPNSVLFAILLYSGVLLLIGGIVCELVRQVKINDKKYRAKILAGARPSDPSATTSYPTRATIVAALGIIGLAIVSCDRAGRDA